MDKKIIIMWKKKIETFKGNSCLWAFFVLIFSFSILLCLIQNALSFQNLIMVNSIEEEEEILGNYQKILELIQSEKLNLNLSSTSTPERKVHVVKVEFEPRVSIILRYDIDWVSFSFPLNVPRNLDPRNPDHEKKIHEFLLRNVDFRPIQQDIIDKSEAERLLQTLCEKSLRVSIAPITPPFFRSRKGIIWKPRSNFLGLRSTAILTQSENKCIRGTIDLRTGAVICQPIACEVE